MTEEDIERHVQFMRDEHWPNWPMLPVKRRNPIGGLPEIGLIFSRAGRESQPFTKVYIDINMHDKAADLETAKFEEYSTFRRMVEAGWEVD